MKKIQLAFSGQRVWGLLGAGTGAGSICSAPAVWARSSTELSSEKEQMGGLEVRKNATFKLLRVLSF